MSQASVYGDTLAKHYRAYRPPLHALILNRTLSADVTFATGVDVGCGTGYSTQALAEYCKHVHGIEPSQAMLSRALPTPDVTYQQGSAENIPLPDHSADIVTYAGVLYYADLRRAAAELCRICKNQARVLVYDFSVVFKPFIDLHGLRVEQPDNAYNHRCNFAGMAGFSDDEATVERIAFSVQPGQLAHLLLSEPHLYEAYMAHYDTQAPYEGLTKELLQVQDSFNVEADIFYTMYTM